MLEIRNNKQKIIKTIMKTLWKTLKTMNKEAKRNEILNCEICI